MTQSRPIGIDLGNTRSVVARVDDAGRTSIVRDSQGDLLVPSVVYFEDEELIYGRAARLAAATQPSRAAEWVKRDLGQRAYSRAIGGQLLPAELIEGLLLKHLGGEAASQFQCKPAVVLSAPASFDQLQRKALRDAGQIAGLDVLGTIGDSLAAALAFAEVTGYLKADAKLPGCRVLAFDLGSGTLDVAIIEIKPGRIRTLSVGGDPRLGGRDWDLRLADYLAAEFAKQCNEDPRYDMVSVRRVNEIAQEAKHTLSARQQARVHVERFAQSADIPVLRQTFDELTAELVERARKATQLTLDRSGLAWRDLAHLLLVGGATRMPMIVRMLEGLTGLKPAAHVHPDEAVARGAALYARQLLARREKKPTDSDVELTLLNHHSLGVEWVDPKTSRAENVVLMPRGSELPCSTSAKAAAPPEHPDLIEVQVLEGESRNADECAHFMRLSIRRPEGRVARHFAAELHYQLLPDGRLMVKAHTPDTRQPLVVEMERRGGLTEKQLAEWKALVEGAPGLKAIHAHVERHAAEERSEPAADLPLGQVVQPPSRDHVSSAAMGDFDDFDHEIAADAMAARLKKRKTTPRQLAIKLAGHVIFAVLGLAIGYYILMRMDPSYNWFHLNLPGLK